MLRQKIKSKEIILPSPKLLMNYPICLIKPSLQPESMNVHTHCDGMVSPITTSKTARTT